MLDRKIPNGETYLKPESACRKLDRGRSWLWNKVKTDASFPKPVYIDHKSPLFIASQLEEWVAARAARTRTEEAA